MKRHKLAESEPGERFPELTTATRTAIQNMARTGLDQLADKPKHHARETAKHLGSAPFGNNVIHTTRSTTISPESYEAPVIKGLDGVELRSTFIERDDVMIKIFGRTVAHIPELPMNRTVGVRLAKQSQAGPSNPYFDYGGFFSMSTNGDTHPTVRNAHPAMQLAAAALVGEAVNRAQHTTIPLDEAIELFGEWQACDEYAPIPPQPDYIWSVFDTDYR